MGVVTSIHRAIVNNVNNDDTPRPLLLLPDELILNILSSLDTVSLYTTSTVDRRFRRLSRDPWLWKKVDLSLHGPISHSTAVRLFRRCTRLEEIRLGNRTDGASLALEALMLHRVKKISLQFPAKDSKMTQEAFLDGVGRFGMMSLRSLEMTGRGIDGEVLASRSDCLKDLTALRLETKSYSRELFVAIAGSCRNLRVLAMDCYTISDDEGMSALLQGIKETIEDLDLGANDCTGAALKIIGECQLLKRLAITMTERIVIDNVGVVTGILDLPRLQFLSLDISTNYLYANSSHKGGGFLATAFGGRRLSLLTDLKLPYLHWSNKALGLVARSCPELRTLDIYNGQITCEALGRLLKECGRLRHLKLGLVYDVSESSLTKAMGNIETSLETLECRHTLYWADRDTLKKFMPTLILI